MKGRFAHGFVSSPDRLTHPLVRRDGHLVETSWADALDLIAERLGRIRAEHGPGAIAAISSARATNEENYLLQKLMRAVIGTNNVDNCSRLCHAPSAAGLVASLGLSGGTALCRGPRPRRLLPARGVQSDRGASRGGRAHQAGRSARRALVVVDPRRTELAGYADVHLRGRPGSNVAVFNGLARVLIDEGLVDCDFIGARRRVRGAE